MQFMTGVSVGKGSLRCDLQHRIVTREAVSEKLEEDVRVLREMQASTAGYDKASIFRCYLCWRCVKVCIQYRCARTAAEN